MSHIELTSMLDSLGSTLSAETINFFFTRNGKKPQEDELTFFETIQCLETEVGRPTNEKKRDNLLDYSSPPTPNMASSQSPPQLGTLDFSVCKMQSPPQWMIVAGRNSVNSLCLKLLWVGGEDASTIISWCHCSRVFSRIIRCRGFVWVWVWIWVKLRGDIRARYQR
jgi:hypothetical protein